MLERGELKGSIYSAQPIGIGQPVWRVADHFAPREPVYRRLGGHGVCAPRQFKNIE